MVRIQKQIFHESDKCILLVHICPKNTDSNGRVFSLQPLIKEWQTKQREEGSFHFASTDRGTFDHPTLDWISAQFISISHQLWRRHGNCKCDFGQRSSEWKGDIVSLLWWWLFKVVQFLEDTRLKWASLPKTHLNRIIKPSFTFQGHWKYKNVKETLVPISDFFTTDCANISNIDQIRANAEIALNQYMLPQFNWNQTWHMMTDSTVSLQIDVSTSTVRGAPQTLALNPIVLRLGQEYNQWRACVNELQFKMVPWELQEVIFVPLHSPLFHHNNESQVSAMLIYSYEVE